MDDNDIIFNTYNYLFDYLINLDQKINNTKKFLTKIGFTSVIKQIKLNHFILIFNNKDIYNKLKLNTLTKNIVFERLLNEIFSASIIYQLSLESKYMIFKSIINEKIKQFSVNDIKNIHDNFELLDVIKNSSDPIELINKFMTGENEVEVSVSKIVGNIAFINIELDVNNMFRK